MYGPHIALSFNSLDIFSRKHIISFVELVTVMRIK